MKFSAIIAMLIVGLNCLTFGLGAQPQSLFADQFIWLWYGPALFWFVGAIQAYFHLKEI